MPRVARIDVEGALYHVISRGVERRRVFRSDRDCEDFEDRLSALGKEEEMRLFAYVLMVNHFHLVVRREGARRLGRFMGRLLTGYAGSFNLRYGRAGHLFQNRYQSILCDEDAYLLQLVRYVHLNPCRAQMVEDPREYRWSSHRDYLSERPRPWLACDEVLGQLGGRRAYGSFVENGRGEGQRPDLCGSTKRLVATARGVAGKAPANVWLGGRVLGDKRFAREVATRNNRCVEMEREIRCDGSTELEQLGEQVARVAGITVAELCGAKQSAEVSQGRRSLVELAVMQKGIRAAEVARYLGISTASVAAHRRKLAN